MLTISSVDSDSPRSFTQVSMRSFISESLQYKLQFDYNRLEHTRATTVMPSYKLRLMDVTGGASKNTLNVRDGFFHMARLNEALNALDKCGWKRSFHQRAFHVDYLRACTRVFFKTEPPGAFERAHKKVLEVNGWDALQQEILISTPRRFGKTISISLFCAALMFACPAVECSIYSTCKRISQVQPHLKHLLSRSLVCLLRKATFIENICISSLYDFFK